MQLSIYMVIYARAIDSDMEVRGCLAIARLPKFVRFA